MNKYRFKIENFHMWRYGYAEEARIHIIAKNIVEKKIGKKMDKN